MFFLCQIVFSEGNSPGLLSGEEHSHYVCISKMGGCTELKGKRHYIKAGNKLYDGVTLKIEDSFCQQCSSYPSSNLHFMIVHDCTQCLQVWLLSIKYLEMFRQMFD